jgi:uncharacterized membrane protein YtjA (UPF0391 family)
MANQEFALAISAVCFGLVIGFFAGYATRAYTFAAAPKTERGRIVRRQVLPRTKAHDRPAPLSSPANGDIADEIRAQPADDAGRRATRFELGAILASDGCLIGVGPASGLGENKHRRDRMLKLALFFFIVSIIAGVFGFTGISAAAAGIAKVLFFIFIITLCGPACARACGGLGNLLGRWTLRANGLRARRWTR